MVSFLNRMSASPRDLLLSVGLVAAAALSAASLPVPAQAAPAVAPAIAWAAGWTTGSGVAQTQARPVSGFNAIAVSGSIDLVVRQSGREAAEVKADDNLLPLIETVVESAGADGRTLKVRWKSGESIHTKTDAVVTVDVKELSAIATAGSGDVKVESLKTPKFSLSISGSSDARLDGLSADEFSVRISGSGDVKAAGSAQRLEIKISGSGDVDTQALQADDVAIAIAGSGDAAVVANRKLAISIAGSGDVVYSGAAAVSQSVAGSGSVRKK
jgi:hypothetical protein